MHGIPMRMVGPRAPAHGKPMRVATKRAGILLANMRPGQLKRGKKDKSKGHGYWLILIERDKAAESIIL